MTTDKQIIIDGVDVSGCDFIAKEDDYCSYSGEFRAYKGQCGCSDEEMCKHHPNCFYKKTLKQLKAKEQECEFSNLRIIQLQETLSQYETDLSTKDCIVETCKAQYKELEAENEQLKNFHINLVGIKECEIRELAKYKQAIEKIKEIAEHCMKQDICTTCDNSEKCHIEDEEIPTYDVCKLILQICDEVNDVY